MVRYINKLNKTLEETAKGINKKLVKENKFFKKKKKKKKEEHIPVPIPTTKICPYCLSEINIHASRCPHCTSILEQKEELVGEQLEINTNQS